MRDESGFSLLEIILSIAALTLISGFILQMFISSLYLNKKAYDLDMGANAAEQALEMLKGGETTDDTITQYFDGQWGRITVEQEENGVYGHNVNLILPDSVKFVLTVSAAENSMTESDVYTSFDTGGGYVISAGQSIIYRLDACVYEIKGNNDWEEIASLSTDKYKPTG